MKRPVSRIVFYLILLTLGLALLLSGISWLCLFGCAMVSCAIRFVGRRPASDWFNSLVCYLGLCIAFVGGIYQLAGVWRHGQVWFRVPPPWWYSLFIVAAWAGVVIKELWPSPPPGTGWQVAVRRWNIRRLKARLQDLPPEKREKFLAQFDRLDRKSMESYRKEIERDL